MRWIVSIEYIITCTYPSDKRLGDRGICEGNSILVVWIRLDKITRTCCGGAVIVQEVMDLASAVFPGRYTTTILKILFHQSSSILTPNEALKNSKITDREIL